MREGCLGAKWRGWKQSKAAAEGRPRVCNVGQWARVDGMLGRGWWTHLQRVHPERWHVDGQ